MPAHAGPTQPEPADEAMFGSCFPAYFEGHLLVGGASGPNLVPANVIARWAGGVRWCTTIDIQAGLVLDRDINTDTGHSHYRAFGGEARLMFRLPGIRVGPHLAIIGDSVTDVGTFIGVWAGARIERGPLVAGADVLVIPSGQLDNSRTATGVYGSIGLRGWPGLIGFAVVTVVWVGNLLINEHGS